mmetsp:Transcript_13548/g.39546  ORF Transcript_13548/g.39546 Transcript_13548/m.39546 type:complete len:210 (+) Transcript_13548:138-767(+)
MEHAPVVKNPNVAGLGKLLEAELIARERTLQRGRGVVVRANVRRVAVARPEECGADAVVEIDRGHAAADRVELEHGMLRLQVVLEALLVLEDDWRPRQELERACVLGAKPLGRREAVREGGLSAVALLSLGDEVQQLDVRRLPVEGEVRVQGQLLRGVRLVTGVRLDLHVKELTSVDGLPRRQAERLREALQLTRLRRRAGKPREAEPP